MKTILLFVGEDEGMDARRLAALDLARAHSGHIRCIAVTPYDEYVVSDAFGGVYAVGDLLEKVAERESALRTSVEASLTREGVPFDYVQMAGDLAAGIAEAGALADVVVLSRPPGEHKGASFGAIDDVAIQGRTPVLAVPATLRRFDTSGPVVVAWDGSAEAAHAVRMAVPLFRTASRVVLLTVEEKSEYLPPLDACAYLSRHGLKTEVSSRPPGGRGVARTLLAEAETLGASVLVMGAYGKSRVREWLLGGVTRTILHQSPLPLFLAH